MRNAKEELIGITDKYDLEILAVRCTADMNFNPTLIQSVEQLDFEYDNGYGSQYLDGIVYCLDRKTGRPVWLTRGEYDGSEWWEVNRIPEFYRKRKLVK